MWYMHDYSGWWMFFGWLWLAVFWASVMALGIWIVRKLTERNGSQDSNNALGIARQRYARGEISREEFEQIKKDLA